MSARARVAGGIVAALAALLLGAASRAPWTASPRGEALLRLSWRAQSEVAERCRPLTEEEKADLPVHMQVPEICETRAIPYRLEVRVDGATVLSETIHGAGARADRPISVFREIPLAAGSHDVRVAFAPVDSGDGEHEEEDGEGEEEVSEGEDEDDEAEEHADEEDAAVALEFSDTIRLDDREIALVTLDPGRRALVRVTPR